MAGVGVPNTDGLEVQQARTALFKAIAIRERGQNSVGT